MKKTLFILALSLVLAGCSDSSSETQNEPTTVTQSSKDSQAETVEETLEETVEETTAESGNSIVLGQPINLGDYTVTVQNLSLVKDYEGKDTLKIVYDWENNSKDKNSPFITIDFNGYQDGVETDTFFMSDDIDLGISQKEVKNGAKLQNVEDGILVDLTKPLELELTKSFSFDNKAYTLKIEDLNEYAQ